MIKFYVIMLNVVLFFINLPISKGQDKGYLYTNLRIPLADYINIALSGGADSDKDQDGLFLNAGYGIKVLPEFFVEAGIDYLIINTFSKRYYDKNFNLTEAIEMGNKAFALQVRPTYRTPINADEDTILGLGWGVNLQKLYISGEHTRYGKDRVVITGSSVDQLKSQFFLTMQPTASISFKDEKSMEYIFGITYSNIRWYRVANQLSFPDFKQEIPRHQTSNLFFSFGFVF